MDLGIIAIDHVNVIVSQSLEDTAKHFYGAVLGLKEIPKPVESQGRGGAWFEIGTVQLHLSVRSGLNEATPPRGHVCYKVADVDLAEARFRTHGVEIIPDDQPVAGQRRFYVRDPGGNLIEIVQQV